MNANVSKYRVDEETFELIISSVNARDDSGPYRCQLFVLNPASGQTSQFRSMPVNLTIDGKISYVVLRPLVQKHIQAQNALPGSANAVVLVVI